MDSAYLLETVQHAIVLRPISNPEGMPCCLPFSGKNVNNIIYVHSEQHTSFFVVTGLIGNLLLPLSLTSRRSLWYVYRGSHCLSPGSRSWTNRHPLLDSETSMFTFQKKLKH